MPGTYCMVMLSGGKQAQQQTQHPPRGTSSQARGNTDNAVFAATANVHMLTRQEAMVVNSWLSALMLARTGEASKCAPLLFGTALLTSLWQQYSLKRC